MSILQLVDKLGGTNYIEQAMDALGLPKPESSTEKLATGAMEGMAGMVGVGGAAATTLKALPKTSPVARPLLEAVVQNPGTAAVAAASGGAAQEGARQAGGGPAEQLLANIAASAVAPAGMSAVGAAGRGVARGLGDVGHAIGAAAGRKSSIERLTADAVEGLTKDGRPELEAALRQATTHVPGAPPTVAEALAERNLQLPGRQVGGELVKLQDQISGHRGVADVLPTKMKENQAAVEKYLEALNSRTAVLREDAFRAARNAAPGPAGRVQLSGKSAPAMGADPDFVRKVIAYALQDREIAGHALARRVLQSVAQDLRAVPKNAQGRIDPEVMQGVRQTAGSKMRSLLKEEPTANQAVAAKALARVQSAIDDAIEQGGATGWKYYMREYSKGMQPVNAHTERLAEANRIVQGIQATSPEELVKGTLPSLPTLLHRPTMAVNFALRLIGKEATDPVTKELAARLADPKEFLELMSRNAKMPVRQRADALLLQASVLANLMKQHQEGEQSP